MEQLLEEVWHDGPWAAVLNPSWDSAAAGPRYAPLLMSWDVAYSFQPIATSGLMRAQGAVLRVLAPRGRGGSSDSTDGSSAWRVLLEQQGGEFVQVGQMTRRPSESDLELAFMNARAASSPLTSLVKGVRGVLDRARGRV